MLYTAVMSCNCTTRQTHAHTHTHRVLGNYYGNSASPVLTGPNGASLSATAPRLTYQQQQQATAAAAPAQQRSERRVSDQGRSGRFYRKDQ
jgi:hypothetical protein